MTRGTLTPEWYQKHMKDSKDSGKPSEELNMAVGKAVRNLLLPGRKHARN